MCTFVQDGGGSVTTTRARRQTVRGRRLLLVACLLVLAGCGSAPAGGPDPTTVTPAPVPSPEEGGRDAVPAGLGIENGTVDGATLVARHADSLSVPRRRVVTFRVETGEATLLSYRENRTVLGGLSLRRRTYEGPATARFVPDATDATSAREVRFDNGTAATRRGFVDGLTRDDDAPPLVAPVLEDGGAEIAALLDGAAVVERPPSSDYRVSNGRVADAAVPEFLTDVSDGSVRASVGPDGRIRRLTVRYDARVGDREVSVIQELHWTRPVTRELR
jgi:hypothetical protein